jgi:ABC-type multidrug transport system permease subunit
MDVKGLLQTLTEREVRRTTLLYGIAVLLHGILDPTITYALITAQKGRETNPLLRPVFEQNLRRVFIGHLPLFAILLACFTLLLYLFHIAEDTEQKQLYWISKSVLSVCIIWGLLLVGWNLYILL